MNTVIKILTIYNYLKSESINHILYKLRLVQSMEVSKGKYIKQIRLAGHKDYFPNKYYSTYDLLDKLNESIKGRYDM
jgi:hypothetical protein